MSRLATPSAPKPSARAAADNSCLTACRSIAAALRSWRHHACQYNQTMALPIALYSTAQVRALDAYAIGSLGIPGYTLMKRAGESALRAPAHPLAHGAPHRRRLRRRQQWRRRLCAGALCASGRAHGDGAGGQRAAASAGDARQAYEDFIASGGRCYPFAPTLLAAGEVIVDALLGTGLHGSVRADARAASSAPSTRRAGRCSRSMCPRVSTATRARSPAKRSAPMRRSLSWD